VTTLEAAIDYQRRGWSVIPLRGEGTVEERKRPLLESWELYQRERSTEETIRKWWAKWPDANVGLVMGAISGIIALDLDGPNAYALLLKAGILLPKTAAVQTGRGHHALFRHPGHKVPNRARLLSDGSDSGVDVRGDGGYVVAPPSIHGSGRKYLWVVHPDEAIAELPPGLAVLLERPVSRPEAPASEGDDWVRAAMAGVGEGSRNYTAARLCGYWLTMTHGNREATWQVMRLWASLCKPPMPEHELRTTLESIARRDDAQRRSEAGKDLPKHPVVTGEAWAEELKHAEPRKGIQLETVGIEAIGGLVPGDLVVLAGRPGLGKSTLACQIAVDACFRHEVPTYIISTEMTRQQWGAWMAAVVSGLRIYQIPKPLPESILAWFRAAPIAISDAGTIGIREIRQLAEGRLGLKLLIVDHIGRIAGGRKETRVLEVGDVARQLKGLAKDLGCTVLALCQLNRRVEGSDDRKPRLSDLRESGEIEQEADSVMFLWTNERDELAEKMPGYITIAKNRHGPLAQMATVFHKPERMILRANGKPEI